MKWAARAIPAGRASSRAARGHPAACPSTPAHAGQGMQPAAALMRARWPLRPLLWPLWLLLWLQARHVRRLSRHHTVEWCVMAVNRAGLAGVAQAARTRRAHHAMASGSNDHGWHGGGRDPPKLRRLCGLGRWPEPAHPRGASAGGAMRFRLIVLPGSGIASASASASAGDGWVLHGRRPVHQCLAASGGGRAHAGSPGDV